MTAEICADIFVTTVYFKGAKGQIGHLLMLKHIHSLVLALLFCSCKIAEVPHQQLGEILLDETISLVYQIEPAITITNFERSDNYIDLIGFDIIFVSKIFFDVQTDILIVKYYQDDQNHHKYFNIEF